MRSVWWIARRELAATLRSPLGFVVLAMYLFLAGLWFNGKVIADAEQYSFEVTTLFFYGLSGFTLLVSIFISMGLIARERERNTMTLLATAPVSESAIVFGKFLGAFAFMALLTLSTFYMPLLIMWHGKVSMGHLFAGYLGNLLLGGAALSIGLFASSLSGSQIVAVFVTVGIGAALLFCFLLTKVTERPLSDVFSHLALYNLHFVPFMRGKIHLRDLVYFLAVTGFFLHTATLVLQSRRWK